MKRNKRNYYMRVLKNNKEVKVVRTHSKRTFTNSLRTLNWKNNEFKRVYLRVSYRKQICSDGCFCSFYNDSYCENKEELLLAFKYFEDED